MSAHDEQQEREQLNETQETPQEMVDRLSLIALGDRECDMSDNDLAALEWLLKENGRLEAALRRASTETGAGAAFTPAEPPQQENKMTIATCGLCGQPMPPGEEMFNYHGYSGPCPVAPAEPQTPEPAICSCGTVMVCPDIGCDKNKTPASFDARPAPITLGCEQDGSEHRFNLSEDTCDCGIVPRPDARPARTLKQLREWAGNRADQSAGRGKPEVFEAWREMVDRLDALLSGGAPHGREQKGRVTP